MKISVKIFRILTCVFSALYTALAGFHVGETARTKSYKMAYKNGEFALTEFDIVEENGNIRLTITPPKDNKILPESREMLIKFCDIEAEDVLVKIGKEPVIVEIENFVAKKNEDFDELKGIILTRVQGKNDEKSMTYGKSLPRFIANAIAEFDALEY